MRQWHLINDPPTGEPASGGRNGGRIGAWNMAVDEAILNMVAAGQVGPVLRFYAWNPPCVSIGYGQPSTDVDDVQLAVLGFGLVRRATGGRAILHTDELTYSLIVPIDHPIAAGGIIESYQRISRALLNGLDKLGLKSQADKRAEAGKISGPVCFEVPSHYEIVTGDGRDGAGRKLVGSAQLRRKNALLQHGTLPLWGDVARICDALVYPDEDAREQARTQVRVRAATLADALGQVVGWHTAAERMAEGFSETFEVEFVRESIVDEDAVQLLIRDVYSDALWTYRI